MATKTFIGTGLLGSNFSKALLQSGNQVNVWNRTFEKAKDLQQFGANVFADVKDAVRNVKTIHVTLKDDASVNEVLQTAADAIMPGAIIVDHTTTSVAGAIERTAYWKSKGIRYQHAPVFMGPANALQKSGIMMVSGDPDVIQEVQNELSAMTGKLVNLGPEPGKAAAIKLAGNSFLVCFTFGVREAMLVAQSLGLSIDDLNNLFDFWNPGPAQNRLQRLSGADHSSPSWELGMARKDTQLFIDAAAANNVSLNLLPEIAKVMDKWISEGFGSHDWTVVGKAVTTKKQVEN